jgi:serine/threonine protein kinase
MVSGKRLCTEAMLKVLQQEIRKGRRRSLEASLASDLVLVEPIGCGGFGSVFFGTWHAVPAAIKVRGLLLMSLSHPPLPSPCTRRAAPAAPPRAATHALRRAARRHCLRAAPPVCQVMNARRSDSEAVSDAMEMAVLSSVQHPNIVQVYSCLTDMVPEEDIECERQLTACAFARPFCCLCLHMRRPSRILEAACLRAAHAHAAGLPFLFAHSS